MKLRNAIVLFIYLLPQVPIVPAVQCVTVEEAYKIARSGFAAPIEDTGLYGQGIYLTTSSLSHVQQQSSDKHVIIVSYVIPGNVYPVIEHAAGEDSLRNPPIKAGYNSHFCLTNKDGQVWDSSVDEECFDELVISQEAQVVPAFIINLHNDSKKQEILNLLQNLAEKASP